MHFVLLLLQYSDVEGGVRKNRPIFQEAPLKNQNKGGEGQMQFKETHVPQVPSENTSQTSAEPISSQQNSVLQLVFPPDHPLCRLQALWAGTQGPAAPVCLSLRSSSFPNMPLRIPDPTRELKRLRILLSHAARTRLDQLFPKGPEGPMAQLEEGTLVLLSGDRMMAWLFLFPPMAQGKELTFPQLCRALANHGITRGVNWPLLRQLPTQPQRYFQLLPIARGTPPLPGEDGRILDWYPRSPKEDIQVDELGQADYVTLKLVQDIQEGDIICEIVPPAAGTPGNTVTGAFIPAPEGQAAAVPQGRNTRLSDDGRFLLAARSGHVEFSGRDFQVKPVLEIAEGELHEAQNIKFLGDIHIHGDLCCGISICAIGNVQIDGVVEACSIEAGENIIVSSGVQGQDQAVLHAQKSVYAKYLEHCSVYAQKNVYADCVINCNLYSNGTVQVRTGRGAVIGGTVRAARQVSAVTVGSKAERPTHIILGGRPCEEAERAQILSELENLTRTLDELRRQPKDPTWESSLSKLRLNQCVIKMKLEKLDKELEEQPFPDSGQDPRRLLCDTAYPGTTVTMGHDSFRVTQPQHNCTIGLANGLVGPL